MKTRVKFGEITGYALIADGVIGAMQGFFILPRTVLGLLEHFAVVILTPVRVMIGLWSQRSLSSVPFEKAILPSLNHRNRVKNLFPVCYIPRTRALCPPIFPHSREHSHSFGNILRCQVSLTISQHVL
jgi:hypothetical protein